MSDQNDPRDGERDEPGAAHHIIPARGPALTRQIHPAAMAEDWESQEQPGPAPATDPDPSATRAIQPAEPAAGTRAIGRRRSGATAPAVHDPVPSADTGPGTRPLRSTRARPSLPDDQPTRGSIRLPAEGSDDDWPEAVEPEPMPEVIPSHHLDPAELIEVESPDDSGIRTLVAHELTADVDSLSLTPEDAESAPPLQAGALLAGQYEVRGPIGRGGLGWVYLARDRKLDGRPVVLKGLKDHSDPDQRAVARAEKRHLAETNHPNLVTVYNVVEDEQNDYIVMQHLAGRSLQQLLASAAEGTLPPHRAITFTIEVLTALEYLHQRGMLHCDIKPANVMQVGGSVKVIDLGAVVRLDEPGGVIYGSIGYQAPETAQGELSVQSDLYTVGRTLLRLLADVPGFDTDYAERLPDPGEHRGLQFDSLYRFLRKACHHDPARRFESAANMAGQALGVRREIVAQLRERDGVLHPAVHAMGSARFGRPAQLIAALSWRDLPEPALGGLAVTRELGLAHAMVGQGRGEQALDLLAKVTQGHPTEWRAAWLRGLIHLSEGPVFDPLRSVAAFNTVYGELPGELAPKLALGYACELLGWSRMAESFYRVCVRTDAAYVPAAAFGLARLSAGRRAYHLAAGKPGEASVEFDRTEAALQLVNQSSLAWAEAAGRLADHLAGGARRPADLSRALDLIGESALPALAAARLRLRVFSHAWDLLAESAPAAPDRRRFVRRRRSQASPVAQQSISLSQDDLSTHLDGHAFDREGLARGLEDSLRRLAALVSDLQERNALIDRANRLRPRTLI